MTEKQIIRDGVDVSGCNFTIERDGKIKCECTHATGFGVICDCESWKTCDYKNYKRKEQECEIWKNQVLTLDGEIITVQITQQQFEEYNQCKTEKEEIKKYLGISSKTIMERLEELQEFRDNDKYKLYQAEQKLERIRELLTNITEAGLCEAKECGCGDNKECLECTLNEIKDVIKIIDEVENAR